MGGLYRRSILRRSQSARNAGRFLRRSGDRCDQTPGREFEQRAKLGERTTLQRRDSESATVRRFVRDPCTVHEGHLQVVEATGRNMLSEVVRIAPDIAEARNMIETMAANEFAPKWAIKHRSIGACSESERAFTRTFFEQDNGVRFEVENDSLLFVILLTCGASSNRGHADGFDLD